MPVSENIDIGLKYRYFHAGSNSASHDDRVLDWSSGLRTVGATFACSPGVVTFAEQQQVLVEQPAGELVYSFGESSAAAAAASASAAAAAAEAPGYSDLSGWIGDPGDRALAQLRRLRLRRRRSNAVSVDAKQQR